MAALFSLSPWAARREVLPPAALVTFGSSPAHSFSLAAGARCAAVRVSPSLTSVAAQMARRRVRQCCTCTASRLSRSSRSCRAYWRVTHAARAFAQRPAQASPQVGSPVPAEKRLKFAAELFDVVDVDGERQLNAQKLQARQLRCATPWPNADARAQVALRVLALPHRPKDVLKRYASTEDCILLEVRRAAWRPRLAPAALR